MLDLVAAFETRKDTIWAKLTIVLAGLLLLGGLVSYYLQAQYEAVLQEKREKLKRVVSHTELKLNGSLMAVNMLAADIDVSSLEYSQLQPKLQKAAETLGLQNAALFDVNGNLLIDAHGIHPPRVNEFKSFIKALGGQPAISNRIVTGNLSTAYVSLRVPVYNQSRQVVAVLAAAMPITELTAIVNEEQLPQGQYVFIIDGAGQFIHHPSLSSIYPEDAEHINSVFAPAKRAYTAVSIKTSVFDNVEKVFIYRPLAHTMWRVSFAVPLQTVYWEVLEAAAPSAFVFALLAVIIVLIYRYLREAGRNRVMEDNIKIERLSAATQMAAGLAHEVRNPLTSIKGFIQLMMKKEDKTNFNNYLEIVLGEIERIDALIGEFQTLARPLRQPNLVRADLGKVTSEVVMLMETQADQKQVTIEYSLQGELFDEGGMWVQADIPQLKQVLINLIRNAVDAVTAGGKVRVTLTRAQEMPAIVIEDNGPGIPPQTINKLGTPFFTTKEGGTGLGLSVCYTIIHNHGGKIKVSSKVGEGTAFTVLFPALRGAG